MQRPTPLRSFNRYAACTLYDECFMSRSEKIVKTWNVTPENGTVATGVLVHVVLQAPRSETFLN